MGISRFKNVKRDAYIDKKGLWVSCDGTTIKDRKSDLELKPNHFRFVHKWMIVKIQKKGASISSLGSGSKIKQRRNKNENQRINRTIIKKAAKLS